MASEGKVSETKMPETNPNDMKVAFVTGAARGIGNAIAAELAADGFSVAALDVRDEEQVREGMETIRGRFGEAGQSLLYVKGDISSPEDRRRAVAEVMQRFGRIDVLVNNAGVAPLKRRDLLEMTEESMDRVLGINLKGTFFLTQAVAGEMIGELDRVAGIRPVIVNISSMSAYTSSVSRGEYCISKAGISMITLLFADRLAEYGIPVYEIRPGIILTDMTGPVKEKYDRLIAEGITPIKRWGLPQDIASAVSVLCSGKLGFSTGEVINVDGGFHIRRL